jgi:5-(carboxyamino)imidazole ribonucleotide synthase
MQIKTRIGILGGGQLSMMLLQKGQALGLSPSYLSLHATDPAGQVSPAGQLGDPKNSQDLKRFTRELEILSFESEFYEAPYLKNELSHFTGTVFPSLSVLQLLQDRKSQKEAFVTYRLTTSPFIHNSSPQIVREFFRTQGSLVAKKRFNGYDGYGTFLLRSKKDLNDFLIKNENNLEDFIFEKLISFKYEVALQAARSRAGHVVFFPFVKTIQKDKKCFLVEGPEKLDVLTRKLQRAIGNFLNKIDYVGVIGFEFFKTSSGYILNEVAPRVHNSGHHTLDSCNVDQFTMHWLCILQDKLPQVVLKSKAFVMLNLIGKTENEVGVPDRLNGSVFWYGKKNRKGRKLGHVNFIGENKKALVSLALKELKLWRL